MNNKPSIAAIELAKHMNGVEIGDEDTRAIEGKAKKKGLVVVYGASDDLMEFVGAINDEIGVYEGGVAYVSNDGVLQDDDYDCGCKFAEQAKLAAQKSAKIIVALWAEEDGFSWTYKTDIPHATFEVMEDGEKYCRGIVFDMAALA